MYGYAFYKCTIEKQIEFLNHELSSGKFDSLEDLANHIFIDVDDLEDHLWQSRVIKPQDIVKIYLRNVVFVGGIHENACFIWFISWRCTQDGVEEPSNKRQCCRNV